MKLVAEAVRSSVAQPVATTITALIVAGVCAVSMSTTGQTVQAEQNVLGQIDAAGTRSIVISDAAGDAGITGDAIDRIRRLTGVEWVIGLGPASDVTAVGIPGGNPAAIRTLHGDLPPQIATTGKRGGDGESLIGPEAQHQLGFQAPLGGVTGAAEIAVVGGFFAADPLTFLNRSLITPPGPNQTILRSVHILVASPGRVADVTDAALQLLGAENPGSIAVETSETLAQIRAAIAGELGRFSRQLVAVILAAGLVLTALAVYGSVTSRRKDFGRRRALGASRQAITALVALQTGTAAALGALIGTVATGVVLNRASDQIPDIRFATAVATLATLTAIIAAIPPALIAAYRDPVRVLRVP